MEEQRPTRCAERQISQFIEDQEVEFGQAFGDLSGSALGLFLFEGVAQLDSREETDLASVMLDGLDAKRGRDMGLACAGSANQHDVLRPVHELAAMKLDGSIYAV